MLHNIQERIERSIYEAIRLVMVEEGYIPDIANTILFPEDDETGQANWNAALQTIVGIKGFAIELFGHGSSQAKGTKKVPRIVVSVKRIFPGEIGAPVTGFIINNPISPSNFIKLTTTLETVNLQFDLHLVSNTAKQDRLLNAIIAKALGQKRNLTFYDVPTDRFFLKQYNYYELPDPMEGIEEKVYSYEVQDLFLFEENVGENIAAIQEINMEVEAQLGDEVIIDGSVKVTQAGINYL